MSSQEEHGDQRNSGYVDLKILYQLSALLLLWINSVPRGARGAKRRVRRLTPTIYHPLFNLAERNPDCGEGAKEAGQQQPEERE